MAQKFFQLTTEAYEASLVLTPTERDLLWYLRSLDPFKDGLEINVVQLAEKLGRHRATINRALKTLMENGWLSQGIKKVRKITLSKDDIPNQSETSAPVSSVPTEVLPVASTPEVVSNTQESPKNFEQTLSRQTECSGDNCSDNATNETLPLQTKRPDDNSPPKPVQAKASESPKTYSNYLKLLKTLSDESQRERFLNFCRRKAAELPQPVRMLDKWIYKNFDFLKAQFQQETGESISQEQSNQGQNHYVRGQGFAVRKPQIKTDVLSPEVVERLDQAIAENRIKNYRYCEPLKRWMVLLNNSAQVEVEVYLDREAIENGNS